MDFQVLEAATPFKILWRDADPAGWIHYASVTRYFDEAEAELFRRNGISYPEQLTLGRGFPRVHFECDFRHPLLVEDSGLTHVAVERIGTTSITLRFELTKDQDDFASVTGRVVMVVVDWDSKAPVAVSSPR